MSTSPPPSLIPGTSTRPYLIRALHEWCTDNGFTPYVAVFVGPGVQVPAEFVKNHEIVLNVSYEATTGLTLGNEALEFNARFAGVAREIYVPLDCVIAIYARENGQGMAFPAPAPASAPSDGRGDETHRVLSATGERGLRLAATSTDEERLDAPVALGVDDSTDPPLPNGPSPARPSLKRIK